MSQLSRLKVGVDVPWVTSWSEETVTGVGDCLTVLGAPALRQVEKPGYGKPNYSENHYRRQRASVQGMLCPMCGGATPMDDRWTLTAKRVAAGTLRARGLGVFIPQNLPDERVVVNAGAIAPLHHDCAKRSSVQCPHLSHDPMLNLRRFAPRWTVSPLYLEPEEGAGDLPLVVGFLQLCGITDAVDRRWRGKAGL